MTHSAKACSIVEGSISIKGGIFHPTSVGGWGWCGGGKPARLQRCREEGTAFTEKGKTNFSRKIKNRGSDKSVNRIALLEVSCAPKVSFSHSFTSGSSHECAIRFRIYYECTVKSHSKPRYLTQDSFCERNIKYACTFESKNIKDKKSKSTLLTL